MTSGPPPGLDRTSRTQGNTSRSKSLLMAAITLGTFGVGNSVLVGPVVTSTSKSCFNVASTCQNPGNEMDHFETLETVGLNHVKLPDFEDVFIDQHLTVAPTVDTSWILFDSGAAANCCPKNFAPEWPLLPITGVKPPLRSVTGQPLKIYGRKLVGMKSGNCEFYLHFYVTDMDYPLVSVGRLLNQGYQVELSSEEMVLKSPCGSKIPLHRHGSLLFMKPSRCLIQLSMNLFVLLSMRSSNQRFLNQLRMRKPRKILLHQLLVSSPFTIMLIDGILILPEMCSLGITSVKERTCLHLKELQTGQLNLRRLHNFERLL